METQIEWWRWVLLILLFGGLFGVWLWVNRGRLNWKAMAKPYEPQIKILERNWVTHQLSIFLVDVKGEKFLLARTPGNLSWQKLERDSEEAKTKKTEKVA